MPPINKVQNRFCFFNCSLNSVLAVYTFSVAKLSPPNTMLIVMTKSFIVAGVAPAPHQRNPRSSHC